MRKKVLIHAVLNVFLNVINSDIKEDYLLKVMGSDTNHLHLPLLPYLFSFLTLQILNAFTVNIDISFSCHYHRFKTLNACSCLVSSPDVIYVSAAGSMLCQIINSLLLLPVSVARPLLSHLLDLLPPLDRLNRLLPAASPLEDQELQWPLHGEQETKQTFTCIK